MSLAIQNRNIAFFNIVEKLPAKRQLIFKLIKKHEPCTLEEICDKYGLKRTVSGRLTELKNDCLILEHGSKKSNSSKTMNTIYRTISNPNERINLINLKYAELRDKKDALINDFNLGMSQISRNILDKELVKINTKINNLEKVLEVA